LIGLPLVLDLYSLLQITLYVIFAILALSLAFIWGYGGILCFGHSVTRSSSGWAPMPTL